MARVSILVSLVVMLLHGCVDVKPVKTLEDGKTGSIEFESLGYPPLSR